MVTPENGMERVSDEWIDAFVDDDKYGMIMCGVFAKNVILCMKELQARRKAEKERGDIDHSSGEEKEGTMAEMFELRCNTCKAGKRVVMDSQYKYPIQYICKITGDRVYTVCYDYPAPSWCPIKKCVQLCREGNDGKSE